NETRAQSIGYHASQKRRDQTSDHREQAKDRHAHGGTLIPIAYISRYPESKATGYKSHQCHRDAVDDITARAEQVQVIAYASARRFLRQMTRIGARVALPEAEQAKQ